MSWGRCYKTFYDCNLIMFLISQFHIDVIFEMRTAMNVIHLFNDTFFDIRNHIYIKQKRGERDQDNEETERECV